MVLEIDDGLVVERELPAVERALEVDLESLLIEDLLVLAGRERPNPPPPWDLAL
jgi:hypothetical protein